MNRQIRRLKRHLPLISWLIIASLIPPIVFAGVIYVEEMRLVRRSLRAATEQGQRRIDTMLSSGSQLLETVEQTVEISDPNAEEQLERLVYKSPLFREIGIINEQGFLVLTNLGKVEPPVWIEPNHRASPDQAELQIVGPVRTAVMEEESIILSLPTQGQGEVNALVNPIILTAPWGQVFSSELGEDGYFAYINMDTGKVLASRGPVPPAATLEQAAGVGRIRFTRTSHMGNVLIIGEVSRSSVLSKWRNLMWLGGVATTLTSGIIVALSMRMVKRTEGLDQELSIGLDNQELAFHYQPIMHLPTGTCIGSEALIRWYHPEQGVLSPGVFIPLAEKTGLINKIGQWAIPQIARDQASLQASAPGFYTSINISPAQIHSGSLEKVLTWLHEAETCQPNHLVFEVTETTTVLSQGTTTSDVLARLRSTGVRIALDDFGQGYSGLGYLHQLDIDILKIDQIYIGAIGKDLQLTSILESIIELAQKLQFTIVAEGIETLEQQQFLCAHGVEYGQGWLFSRPLPIHEFEAFLNAHSGAIQS